MIKEITSLRPRLRAWAATQPDAIRIRAGFVDKNLKAVAEDLTDALPFEALKANLKALQTLIAEHT